MGFGKILNFRRRKNLKIKYLNKLILKKKFFSKFQKISIPNTIFIGKNPNVFFYKLEADKKIKLYFLKKTNIFSITEEIKIIVFWSQKI